MVVFKPGVHYYRDNEKKEIKYGWQKKTKKKKKQNKTKKKTSPCTETSNALNVLHSKPGTAKCK